MADFFSIYGNYKTSKVMHLWGITLLCELVLAIAIFFDKPSFYKLGQDAIGSEDES